MLILYVYYTHTNSTKSFNLNYRLLSRLKPRHFTFYIKSFESIACAHQQEKKIIEVTYVMRIAFYHNVKKKNRWNVNHLLYISQTDIYL